MCYKQSFLLLIVFGVAVAGCSKEKPKAVARDPHAGEASYKLVIPSRWNLESEDLKGVIYSEWELKSVGGEKLQVVCITPQPPGTKDKVGPNVKVTNVRAWKSGAFELTRSLQKEPYYKVIDTWAKSSKVWIGFSLTEYGDENEALKRADQYAEEILRLNPTGGRS